MFLGAYKNYWVKKSSTQLIQVFLSENISLQSVNEP